MNRARLCSIGLIVAALTGGCTTIDGAATPADPVSTSGQHPEFPPIPQVLSVRPYLDRPCAVIPKTEVAKFGVDLSTASESRLERSGMCTHYVSDRGGAERLTISLVDEELLRSTLDDTSPENLTVIDIAGYPALRLDVYLSCQIVVGVADAAGFYIVYQPVQDGPTDHDTICGMAIDAAEHILDRLPPA